MQPTLTIRIGANVDDVIVDGVTFDRSKMTGPEKGKLARMLISGLHKAGVLRGRWDPYSRQPRRIR